MDVPLGSDGQQVLRAEFWPATPVAAQALIVALAPLLASVPQLEALQERVRELEARLGQRSGNSSRPPSNDPPQATRRPLSLPTGRARGGQPGHVAHQRGLVRPERVDRVVDHWPLTCSQCRCPLPEDAVTRAAD